MWCVRRQSLKAEWKPRVNSKLQNWFKLERLQPATEFASMVCEKEERKKRLQKYNNGGWSAFFFLISLARGRMHQATYRWILLVVAFFQQPTAGKKGTKTTIAGILQLLFIFLCWRLVARNMHDRKNAVKSQSDANIFSRTSSTTATAVTIYSLPTRTNSRRCLSYICALNALFVDS